LISLLGPALILLGFCAFPWLEIAPMSDIDQSIKQSLSALLDLVQKAGPLDLRFALTVLRELTALPGWKLVFLNIGDPLYHALVLCPTLLAVFALFGAMVSLGERWHRARGVITYTQLISSIVLFAFLVLNIPHIERVGLSSGYLTGIVLAVLGIRLGWGFWVTLGGVSILGVASALQIGLPEGPESPATENTSSSYLSIEP